MQQHHDHELGREELFDHTDLFKHKSQLAHTYKSKPTGHLHKPMSAWRLPICVCNSPAPFSWACVCGWEDGPDSLRV